MPRPPVKYFVIIFIFLVDIPNIVRYDIYTMRDKLTSGGNYDY